MRSSPPTRGRCPAPAARSTGIRWRSGSVPTAPWKRWTSTGWRPGHGDVFDKAVVTETREYFEYLVAQVSAGIRPGRPLADLVESVTLDRYKGWANYERLRRMNVEAAYLNLTSR